MTTETPRLAAVEAFRDLTPEQHYELEQRLELLPVAGGTCLVREGEAAQALFLVLSGRFEVLVKGRAAPIAEIGVGSPIGEIAFFAGGERTATVKAQRDSLVLRLLRKDFEDLVALYPQMWTGIAAALARRLAATTAGAKAIQNPRPRTIAICHAGGGALDPSFLRCLRDVFDARSDAIVLDRSSALGQSSGGAAGAIAHFNELEGQHDYVLYIADAEPTEWSQKALRQADMVLCVGRQTPNTSVRDRMPNVLETLAFNIHKPENVRLVLMHDTTGTADGTRNWLEVRPQIGMHHHVGIGERSDYERLYRFISGTALGFVACGGGAFSSAHIGLYQAFREAGLSFDIMGGTSGGAAMTAAFALGADPDEIERRTHDIFVTRRAFRRWTLPRYSLLDHSVFDRALQEHFTKTDIEDLWVPYFAISTNLSCNAAHRHISGPIWQAVRASCSIPALLPPVYTAEGEMLVDGCLADNVPLRAMQGMKSGPNIVVDFHVPQPNRQAPNGVTLPTRREMLWASMTRAGRERLPQLPSPATVLLRGLMLNRSDIKAALGADDVLLEPEMPAGMNHLDWHRHGELRRGAYRFATAEMKRLAELGHPIFGEQR